ncbi:serine/threonine-protein phosphatase 7 long form homolog [Silene latifolia]|uniref:serine/threonine-protein phosphatase 7 long form homolog n=1 Tax=Silene latifolia TaxID=37657 RepID=UPI003D771D07
MEGLKISPVVTKHVENNFEKAAHHKVEPFNSETGVYQVKTRRGQRTAGKGGHRHTVNLSKRTCTCNKFQIYHFPCSHVAAVCRTYNLTMDQFIDLYFTCGEYLGSYKPNFYPVPDERHWPNWVGLMDPGPLNPELLTLQAGHRSESIWNGVDHGPLKCRVHLKAKDEFYVHPRVRAFIKDTQFYEVHLFCFLYVDPDLITALVSGKVVTGRSDHYWPALCEQLLGLRPSSTELKDLGLKLTWLSGNFSGLPQDADDDRLHKHIRAYILYLIGTIIFPDKSGRPEIVRSHLVENEGEVYPLGSQMVAGKDPLGCTWLRVDRKYKDHRLGLVTYRDMFDKLIETQFTWQPYTQETLQYLTDICHEDEEEWVFESPLICFEIIEMHLPNRVVRQFGWHPTIPPNCNTEPLLHKTDRRGKTRDYATEFSIYLNEWDNRKEKMLGREIPYGGFMSHHDPYMIWYRKHTRRIVSP